MDGMTFSFVFFLVFIAMLILMIWWAIKKLQPTTNRRVAVSSGQEMELDIRLPYKRFKELYPYTKITYQEYKQMQMRNAFKRAVSSQENKRMVR